MVIRGNSRGNARQLSHYLLAKKDNEAIRILDVDGLDNVKDQDLHRAIFLMGVSAELSRSEKGLYHAQINPAIGEDAKMLDDHWLQAGDILGKQLGLEKQRRAIVLHTKKGRTHAHVVWERYDHEQERMVSDSFSRLAQDRARREMEQFFNQEPTPHRNKHRPELKANLLSLWNQTGTGAQFVKAARKNGYIISAGSGRSPFVVVDEYGRSYGLNRQLQGVRLKDIRQRLRQEHLLGEKDAIIMARRNAGDIVQECGNPIATKISNQSKNNYIMEKDFETNKDDITANNKAKAPSRQEQFAKNKQDIAPEHPTTNTINKMVENKHEITGQKPEKTVKEQFAENKKDTTQTPPQTDKEKRREAFRNRMKTYRDNSKERGKDRGIDID